MEDTELKALRPFVEQEIPVVSEALGMQSLQGYHASCTDWQIQTGSKPTAVNLWIGDKRSVTSLHKGKRAYRFYVRYWADYVDVDRPLRKHLYCAEREEDIHSP